MGWYAIDFDGTLALYETGMAKLGKYGKPVPEMQVRVKKMIAEGKDVRVFTARAFPINLHVKAEWSNKELDELLDRLSVNSLYSLDQLQAAFSHVKNIRAWTAKYLGKQLTVTNVKDPRMVAVFDDRAVTVEKNTGKILTRKV